MTIPGQPAPSADPEPRPAPRSTTTYALVVLLVATASVVWMFLTPLGSVPDEPSHVQYAAAIVRGQTGTGSSNGVITIPADVEIGSSRAACTSFAAMATTRCQPPITSDSTPVQVVSPAAGYPPLYYVIVGLPTLTGFSATTWYVMRLLSVAIGVGLLAAFLPVSRRYPPGWLVVGSVVAVTPMATYLLASVNPNGAEIFAGLATAMGLAFLMLAARAEDRVGFVRATTPTALALSYLILARPESYLLAGGLIVVALLMLPRGTASLARSSGRALAVRAVLPAFALLAALAFQRLDHVTATGDQPPMNVQLALRSVVDNAGGWVAEMVGVFGWRDFRPQPGVAFAWLAVIAAVTVMAFAAGRWRARLGLGTLVVGGTAAAPLFALLTVFRDGGGYQGRYQMSLTVAIPVVAAAVLATSPVIPGILGTRLARWLPWALATLYALIWGGSLLRYSLGLPLPTFDQLAETWTWWLNPVGTTAVVVAFGAYLTSVAVLSRRLGNVGAWRTVLHRGAGAEPEVPAGLDRSDPLSLS